MLQFSVLEIERFKERLKQDSAVMDKLKKDLQEYYEYLSIPQTGIATWELFYACPKDSVRLVFNIKDSSKHLCPVCGEYFTGEPYDGAWWRLMNTKNEQACNTAGLIYSLMEKTEPEAPEYFSRAKRILMEYAKYYPNYEVHGNIPYNNPGKANAQTLCDANWIRGLIKGYDFIREDLTDAECNFIEENLFIPAADFFMKYRSNQIHNHEVIVNATIGILGLLLNRQDFLDFAVNQKYGLKYQLERGLLKDGFWFEGTTSYHYYALEQFIEFEHFAKNTSYTFLNDPSFLDLYKFPLNIMQPNYTMPLLNDIGGGKFSMVGKQNMYELLYKTAPCKEFEFLLSRCYDSGGGARNNLHAFLYGVEEFQPVDTWPQKDYHNSDGSGLTVLRGKDSRYLLVKHSPYGGEHDHYDRLGIDFMAFGKTIAPDIGTCAYGAPLHYAYYKNTGSHNTICINGKNQPPASCKVLAYERNEDCVLLDTEVKWDKNYVMPDSFTIKQWDDEAYEGVSVRRKIIWYGDFFVDVCKVNAPEDKDIDWILHVKGERETANGESGVVKAAWGDTQPYCYLKNVTKLDPSSNDGASRVTWRVGNNAGQEDEILFDLHILQGNDTYFMTGPDNPSVSELSYLIQRKTAAEAVFVNVFEAYRAGEKTIADVRLDVDRLSIKTKDSNVVVEI